MEHSLYEYQFPKECFAREIVISFQVSQSDDIRKSKVGRSHISLCVQNLPDYITLRLGGEKNGQIYVGDAF